MSENQIGKYVVIGNKSYGLYAGRLEAYDPVAGVASVARCRHVAYWVSGVGGITSLVAQGPQEGSRIGQPCDATLTGVVNVFACSPEAERLFEAY